MHTLKERVLHPMRRTGYDRLEALRDVSFEVQPGEFFGIVGRNGSGKSTLLKCLAGIYRADAGRIYIDGRLSTFIELGVGFNPELPARDNVVLNALMLGLSPREARQRVDSVIEFAELEEFAELKLKNYSSGMHVRLAFSVMIQVDADVLLIDEVLAVGDAAFQQKCFDEFHRLRAEGRTILLVTHDMSAVSRFCDRAVLLERGRLVAGGPPDEIAEQYLAMNFARQDVMHTPVDSGPPAEHAVAVIREVWFEDEYGQTGEFLPQSRRCIFKARIELRRDVDELRLLAHDGQRQRPARVQRVGFGRGAHLVQGGRRGGAGAGLQQRADPGLALPRHARPRVRAAQGRGREARAGRVDGGHRRAPGA